MSESLFEVKVGAVLDTPAIATGHATPVMAWEDAPGGKRRPSKTTVERDEVTGLMTTVVDVLLPLGRDGQPIVIGVRVQSTDGLEVPSALTPVEFDGLRVRVAQHKSGKGVDVSLSANAVRPAGSGAHRPARRVEGEAA